MEAKTAFAGPFRLILRTPAFCQSLHKNHNLKTYSILTITLFAFAAGAFAQTGNERLKVQERRIEQEKRIELEPSQQITAPEIGEISEPAENTGFDYFRYLIKKYCRYNDSSLY